MIRWHVHRLPDKPGWVRIEIDVPLDIEEEVTGRFAAVDGKSVPPKAKFALAVLDKLTPAGRTVVVVLALLVFAALAGLSLWRGGTGLGWW